MKVPTPVISVAEKATLGPVKTDSPDLVALSNGFGPTYGRIRRLRIVETAYELPDQSAEP